MFVCPDALVLFVLIEGVSFGGIMPYRNRMVWEFIREFCMR